MPTKVDRRTVDLSQYPDLVVIYLGMRVNRLTGLKTLFGFGPKISASVEAQPQGLLLHETIIYSMFPPNVGMRQYWRDMDSLLAWSRSEPHREWWKAFLRNSGGTGFWHETYLMHGGMEAIRGYGGNLRRRTEADWISAVCSGSPSSWSDVHGGPSHRPSQLRGTGSVGIGPV
jgi:hypothetical protein